ncbi:uncharacterized protein METZ01_LOCUS21569 [marine metagenome]|uniref:Uncharacterized protein n=1 Tax=marine metagenome TaxID=408172 RepID=A0A381PNW0_9ZZZZ
MEIQFLEQRVNGVITIRTLADNF